MSDAIKVGDRFLVEVEVTPSNRAGAEWKLVVAEGRREPVPVPRAWLAASKRLPRALKVGDRVRVRRVVSATGTPGAILAADDDEAWVKWDTGGHSTWSLSDLTLAEESAS